MKRMVLSVLAARSIQSVNGLVLFLEGENTKIDLDKPVFIAADARSSLTSAIVQASGLNPAIRRRLFIEANLARYAPSFIDSEHPSC